MANIEAYAKQDPQTGKWGYGYSYKVEGKAIGGAGQSEYIYDTQDEAEAAINLRRTAMNVDEAKGKILKELNEQYARTGDAEIGKKIILFVEDNFEKDDIEDSDDRAFHISMYVALYGIIAGMLIFAEELKRTQDLNLWSLHTVLFSVAIGIVTFIFVKRAATDFEKKIWLLRAKTRRQEKWWVNILESHNEAPIP